MLIGVDGNEANVDKKVGISEFAFELLLQLSSSKFNPPAGGQSSKFVVYLKGKPRDDLPKENENWKYRIVKPSKLWTQFGLPVDLYLGKVRPDVFFSPTHYAPRFSPIPSVVSIMDLAFLHFPETFKKSDLFQLKTWTSYSVKNASAIITISQSTKDDIMKEYRIASNKVFVVYPGIKLKSQNSNLKSTMQKSKLLKDKYNIDDEYVMFVGTLQPRKNIERLVAAFEQVIKKRKGLKLVIIGKKGWLYEGILRAPRKYDVEKNVKFLEYVSDEELPELYKNAICFVLPSLYEGFGLPVLEAMRYGCPVITSNISSLPEAGGDAALYIDPMNVDDIADRIIEVVDNQSMRAKMIKKGYEQVKKFSWEKSAKQVLEVLEEVGSRK